MSDENAEMCCWYGRLLARDLTPRSIPSPLESSVSSISDDDVSEVLPYEGE